MSWARILVPISGAGSDAGMLAAGAALAEPFGAEVVGVFTPPDLADLVPWMSDGMVGGMEVAAIEALKSGSAEGEAASRRTFEAAPAGRKNFVALKSPVLSSLALEARLSDVVVFDQASATHRSRLSEAFHQLLAVEQRPILVARRPLTPGGRVLIAWNGSKEAARAARTAMPLLKRAARVVITTVDETITREVEPQRLAAFLGGHGVRAEAVRRPRGDAAGQILAEAAELGADVIVSGAFGHARLREYVLGGATRNLLNSDGPSLFLSH